MLETSEPYYLSLGEGRFKSTIQAQGAWNPNEQHMAPVTGLLTHLIETFQPKPQLRISRISFEILGLIPGGEFQVRLGILRPGRTIELVQAEMSVDGRACVVARAWRLEATDTSGISAINDEPMASHTKTNRDWDLGDWPGGYIHSIRARLLPDHEPGKGRAWLSTEHPLLGGVHVSDMARLLGLVDTSNGIATLVPAGPGSWAFPNVDLQIHMYREPTGEWLGLQNSVSFGAEGVGLTSSVLHDEVGPFGRAEQILTLRRIPPLN
ncbi:MAG: thioesterase family protein [Cryobacterium sp.]|nr:thioesterase family protein [Cryobacterium sp.]